MTGNRPTPQEGRVSATPDNAKPQEPRRAAWSSRKPAHAALFYVGCYLTVSLIGGQVVAWLARSATGQYGVGTGTIMLNGVSAAVTLIGAAVLLISLLLVLSICRLQMSPGRETIWIAAMLVVFAAVRPAVFAFVGKWMGHPVAGKHLAETLSVMPGQLLLGNTALIVWASFLGRLVSRIIREGKLILPVAVVACIADIITVFWGIVAHVSKTSPEVVETFSAVAPVVPPPNVSAPILSAVGIGDFLFYALFLAVALRYAMRPTATMWATFAVMLVAPIAFYLYPSATGMPGLPLIGAAALWANWRFLRFTAEEKQALSLAGMLVLLAAFVLWMALHR